MKKVGGNKKVAQKKLDYNKKSHNSKNQWWIKFWYVVGLTAWVFLVVVGIQFLVGVLVSLFLPKDVLTSPLINSIFSVITYILALLILIFLTPKIVQLIKKQDKMVIISRERIGLRGLPTWTDIGLSPIGYVTSILIAMGITWLFTLLPWFDANETQDLGYSQYMLSWERGLAFITLVVIAPIVEEIIFRGWLYGKLRIIIPKWLAILITSLLFGIIHMQWNVGISVFAMSIVTCTLREITGTIYSGMLVHMINNGVAFCLVYVFGMS